MILNSFRPFENTPSPHLMNWGISRPCTLSHACENYRMKKLTAFITLALFALPLAASADQITDLQAQVQILPQVLAKLQAQRAAGGSVVAPPSSCPAISGPLGPGSSGPQVSALQQFLASDHSVYPEGKITG